MKSGEEMTLLASVLAALLFVSSQLD